MSTGVPAVDLSLSSSVLDDLLLSGLVVLPVWSAEVVDVARAAFAELGAAPDDGGAGRFDSWDSRDSNYVRRAHDLAAGLVGRSDARSHRFRTVWPGPGSGSGLQPAGASPGWCTVELLLDGVYEWNGPVWVVSGSHRWIPDGAVLDEAAAEWVGSQYATRIDGHEGSAFVSHPRLLTFSTANTDRPRRSIVFELPVDLGTHAPTLEHALRDRVVTVDALAAVERDGSLGSSEGGPSEPPLPEQLRCIWCHTPLGPAPSRWSGSGQHRCDECGSRTVTAPVIQASARGRRVGRAPQELPEDPAPVLRSRDADERLRRDGFVVLEEPIIDPERAASLRERFGALHQWQGAGHLNDFNRRDLDYREAATELMRSELDDALAPLFVDHEPFLHTFLCKWPGEDSYLEPHRDWMYVDERKGERSFLAFVALDEVVGERGRLQMLRGSHRMDAIWRGTDLHPRWLACTDTVQSRLETIDVAVGQCVLWNSALVHASLPNVSDEPRVAAGAWYARRGAKLVHFRRLDASSVGMFEIDDDFYRTQNPYRLLVANPPYELRERLELVEPDWDDSEFGRRLDQLAAQPRRRRRWRRLARG